MAGAPPPTRRPPALPALLRVAAHVFFPGGDVGNRRAFPQDAYLQKVIVTASEGFLGVVKGVRGTVDKRNRKLIDHDRWLTNVKKAQEANEKAGGAKISDVTKAETQFDLARQEYESINNRIKAEMPVLFGLRPAFVDPILQTLVIFGVRPTRPAPFEGRRRAASGLAR